jgi:predicted nucleic acid-binding protein
MKLFDSDVLIEHLRGNGQASQLIGRTGADGAISVLTRFELLAGMRSGERHAVRALVDTIPNLRVTEDISTRAGEWARLFRRSHASIGPIDFLIAATAEVSGADLFTLNVRHYPMFPNMVAALG